MDPETLRILQAADDSRECEVPSGFDWDRESSRARQLVPVLEEIVGRKFHVESPQDASFFADVTTYDDRKTPGGTTVRTTVLAVRLSSFGKLFSLWAIKSMHRDGRWTTGDHPSIAEETKRRVIEAVRHRDNVYVDFDDLQEPYTGANPHFVGRTWWVRFFDYI